MRSNLTEREYEQFWRRLQRLGLNGYEARAYLALLGHPRSKALDVSQRAEVPRQKIYEILDSLTEKGFTQTCEDRTRLFSAVEPGVAIPQHIARQGEELQRQWLEQSRIATDIAEELTAAVQGDGAESDFVRLLPDPSQCVKQRRQLLAEARTEHAEFVAAGAPQEVFDPAPLERAVARGVRCRVLVATHGLDGSARRVAEHFRQAGAEVRETPSVPLRMVLIDQRRGLVVMPGMGWPSQNFTTLEFCSPGLAEGMHNMFDKRWEGAGSLR